MGHFLFHYKKEIKHLLTVPYLYKEKIYIMMSNFAKTSFETIYNLILIILS